MDIIKLVNVGSRVTVEVYLGRSLVRKIDGRSFRYMEYERHRVMNKDYIEVFTLVQNPDPKKVDQISPESFIGRVLLGAQVGNERETDFGVSLQDVRVGNLSGCHLKYKIISID